jgi:hypothetical protein
VSLSFSALAAASTAARLVVSACAFSSLSRTTTAPCAASTSSTALCFQLSRSLQIFVLQCSFRSARVVLPRVDERCNEFSALVARLIVEATRASSPSVQSWIF